MSPETVTKNRIPEYPANQMFINRWSPRSLSGEPISKEELFTLFEAARWAPSSYNSQPWRFIYAYRESREWQALFGLMMEFNQGWTKNAAVLVVIISRKNFDHNGQFSRTHSFDTGAAWANLALQGSLKGLVVHGMSGFDYDKARKVLNVPEDYDVEAMFAVGKPGKKEDLPPAMQEMEIPSTRKNVAEIVFEGKYQGS